MAIINVTLIPDVDAILRDHTVNASTTTALANYGKGYVFFVTEWNDVNFGGYYGVSAYGQEANDGGYQLDIKAEIGDSIRWRATTLTLGFAYQCFIQFFNFSGTSTLTPLKHTTESISIPTLNSDGTISPKQSDDYYYETTIKSAGYSSYTVPFSLFGSDGGRVGIFTIDPHIEVPGQSRYSLA